MPTTLLRPAHAGYYDPSFVADMRRKTENNDHVGAVVVLAKMVGAAHALQLLGNIDALVRLEGRMPSTLQAYFDAVCSNLHEYAQHVLTPEEYRSLPC